MPTNRDFRHAIEAGFFQYAAENGGLKSHMTAAYIQYMLKGRPGLTPEQQIERYVYVHTAFQHLLNADPQNALLYELHDMIHAAYKLVISNNNLDEESLDVDDEDDVDPLVTHADDFAKWAEGLADPEEIEQEYASEEADKDDED